MTNELTRSHRELMARRLRAHGLAARTANGAADRSVLTASQRRMWFGQRRSPASAELNVPFAVTLSGPLDADRLLGALRAVVERHPALRTVFPDGGEGPRRSVRAAQVQWQYTDARGVPAEECERRVAVLARRDADAPFDLARDPLLRAHLIRTAEHEYVLAMVVHHIAFDDASFGVFFEDLSAAYSGTVLSVVDDPAVHVEVDPARVDDAAQALRPLPDPVTLPGDTGVDEGPAWQRILLPPGLDEAVAGAARERGVTPFTWLLGVHAVLLARLFDADDAAVSLPVTARPAGTEEAIGYFGNIAVRRLTVRPGDTFAALVTRLQEEGSAALAHADVPIDAVIGALSPARGGDTDGFGRFVQLSFTTRAASTGPRFEGIRSETIDLATPGAQVPFEVSIIRPAAGGSGAVQVEVRYRRGRVDAAAVQAYLDAFPVVVAASVAEPDGDLRRLALSSPEQTAFVIAAGRGPAVPDARPDTVIALWEHAVDRVPDAVALRSDEVSCTYAEVDRRAQAITGMLIDRGVCRGDIVAIEIGGSVDFVVAAIAVMKTGSAYLPVDPTYPLDRRRLLVDDARPRLVLDAETVRTAIAGIDPATPLARETRTQSTDPAYVIYTSGSTGRPKGVLVSQAAIAEHLAGHLAMGSFTPDDRVLLTSSVSFDASIFEIFATLAAGATLVIGRPGGAADFGYVSDLVHRHAVTVVHMVPSTLATYLLLPGVQRWRGVRWIPVGGEALPGEVCDRARAVLGARISNNYGPTEAVVASTGRMVDEPRAGTTVPIGVPTPGTALYILDRALQPVPDGIAGELYIGGDQLAMGYLGDAARTGSRFVADPWRPGRRMYRTGDRVRRLPDGDLEFLGRTDDQVKIHGFRIEPGEVAAVLSSLEGVGQAAVVPIEDPVTGTYLAAYLSPADVDVDAVAAAAAHELPAHLVPAAYVPLASLPLGPNGKLARSALPVPQRTTETGGRAPATTSERIVAAAVATLLERPVEDIAATDSFFALGGHSLLVTRLVAALRAEAGVTVGVRTVFDGPTIERIAAAVDAGGDGELGLPPVTERQELSSTLPLTASQRSIWFAAAMAAATGSAGSAAGAIEAALECSGPVDVSALSAALADAVARRDALRTVFGVDNDVPFARVLPHWAPELDVEQVAASAWADSRAEYVARPFVLEGQPLLRARLVESGDRRMLQIVVHHLVVDHRSIELLLDDVATAYRARSEGRETSRDAASRFADYALWQAEVFASEAGRAAVDAVAARLRDLPLQIPARHDHPRRAELSFARGHRETFEVDASVRARLREVAQRHGTTEFVLADAALAVLLHRHAGGRDIAIGTPADGRTEPAVDETVGVLANMVALRTAVDPDSTLADVLDRARGAAADAFGGQAAPFELVVDAAAPPRRPGLNPLFQTVLHVRDDAAALAPRRFDAELTATRLPMDFDVALVDLAVSLLGTADGGYGGAVIASPAVYDASTAAVLADAMPKVLQAFTDPATRVRDVLPDFAVLAEPLMPDDPQTAVTSPGEPAQVSELSAEQALPLLTGILEELLGVAGITGADNYFAVGGDSVTSLQFASRAAEVGVPITPQQVFETATLDELVARVTTAEQSAPPQAPVAPAAPMSASGLDADQLAALSSAWQGARS